MQRVLFNCSFPQYHSVPTGVIQGSGLAPLIFNIFMSDLPSCVNSPLIMYADDSTLYRYIDSYADDVQLQDDINIIQQWCQDNGMRMNANKSAFTDVTLSKLRGFVLYNISGNPIPHADYIKLLGVFVAFDLS
jgi:hypothetical protein